MSSETKILVGVLAATVVIIVGGAFLYGRQQTTTTEPISNPERLVREDDAVWGPADAKVTVVEFGDFECPSCGAVYPIFKQLKEDNKEASVRFVYRHFPITSQHEHAQLAAEAAVAAQQQGKFWEYHDMLFEHQSALDQPALEKYAQELGLDTAAFTQALNDHTHKDAVEQDRGDGVAVGVQGTPTFYINNVPYTGSYSLAGLQSAVDAALK